MSARNRFTRLTRRARSRRGALAVAAMVLAGCGAGVALTGASASGTEFATTPTSPGVVRPTAIPLGDGYVSTTPKVGYVDSCQTSFGGIGGATVAGPWIDTTTKTWNLEAKIAVAGAVGWAQASYRVTVSGNRRIIKFNDLPIDHTTGVFPIATTDPAHAYDQNGNHIEAQDYDWSLPLTPKVAARPSCDHGGPIGVLSDGVALFDALDGEGRDAGAHEVLDSCAGHPDPAEIYHHHYIPPCILTKTPNGKSTLVGYALDGFGIYVVKNAEGVMPSNTALDACHGTTSRVLWNGRMQRIYHYVATLEYPYTVGCFRGTAISGGGGGGGQPTGPPAGPPGSTG